MRLKTKITAIFLVLALSCTHAQASGIPTFDGAQAAAAAKQLLEMQQQLATLKEQLTNQVKQLENMVMNSIAPATYLWSEADKTVAQIMALQDQLNSSNLEGYLAKYKDLDFYRNNPSNEQIAAIQEEQIKQDYEAQQKLAKAISKQQEKLNEDASRLRNLQANTSSAKGHLEALQYANQYASLQNDQLMQMRSLMMQQAAAQNARDEIEADKRARAQAFREKAMEKKWQKGGGALSFD